MLSPARYIISLIPPPVLWVLAGGLLAFPPGIAHAGELRLGVRTLQTTESTKEGVPVVPMWTAPQPTREPAAGFPVVAEAEHFDVWRPSTLKDWKFNHFAALVRYGNRFYAMWGNHPLGELGPGQRVLYTWSDDDGRTWQEPKPLFPQPGKVAQPGETPDIHVSPDRWIVAHDRLYAVGYVVGNGAYPIAREVNHEGRMGAPFVPRPPPGNALLPSFMKHLRDPLAVPPAAAEIWDRYEQTDQVTWWGTLIRSEGLPKYAVDRATMIEPFTYRARDGTGVLLLRSMPLQKTDPENNHRLYVSFETAAGGWSTPYPTDIPDSPSRFEVIVLDDGTTLLIGNQVAPEFDRWTGYLPRDPLTVAISDDGYTFDRVFALRTGAPKQYRFEGISRRSLGYGYPSSVVHDGWLYSLYSVGKEDMAFTRVPLSALGLKARNAKDRSKPGPTAGWNFNDPAGRSLMNVGGTSSWSADLPGSVTTGTGSLRLRWTGTGTAHAAAPIPVTDPTAPIWMIVELKGWQMEETNEASVRFGIADADGHSTDSGLGGLRLSRREDGVYLTGETLPRQFEPIRLGDATGSEHAVVIFAYHPDSGVCFLVYQVGEHAPVRIGPGRVERTGAARYITIDLEAESTPDSGDHIDIDGIAIVPTPVQADAKPNR